MTTAIEGLGTTLALTFVLAAQTPQPATTALHAEFEVASVKLVDHPVAPHGVALIIKHGTLTMDAAQLRQIIGLAYNIQRVRVHGGPDWLDHEMYDIQAKAENPEATRDEIRAMLQSLLADRFKLAYHRETKQLPVYTLVVAKNGPKFDEAKDEERGGMTTNMVSGKIQWTYQKGNLGSFCALLANMLGSPVQDETGLDRLYDFKLEVTPDSIRALGNAGPVRPNSEQADPGPSIFTALQEQLGLKLEERKGPVEVMVVDHADHASAN
jgi:uncharacterized protein (TIGR03435 family)